MPLPPDKDYTEEDLQKEMQKRGWKKSLTIEWVTFDTRDKKIHKNVYLFNVSSAPCSQKVCKEFNLAFYTFKPTGVYWSCASCRRTMGPIAFEDGTLKNKLEISLEEAMKIIDRTGQIMPIGLRPRRGGRIVRKKIL